MSPDCERMLLVDTCGATGLVGLASLQPRPAVLSVRTLPGRETQERLMAAVSEVLEEGGCNLRQVHAFAVVSGPGSFTGVRIGVAAVKGFAEAGDRPLVAVSRLAVLAGTASAPRGSALLDAGRGEVYLGAYDSEGCWTEQMLPLSAALQAAGNTEVLVCEPALFAACPEGSVRLLQPPSAEDILRAAVHAMQSGSSADRALLDANYLRVPDAELALRALQSKGVTESSERFGIRSATEFDLPKVAALANRAPGAPAWTEGHYAEYARPDEPGSALRRVLLVAVAGAEIAGFLAGTVVCGEAELESVAVAPEFRRRGIGLALLDRFHQWCRDARAEAVRLEVRRSNVAAQALYRAAGYVVSGERARYYTHPSEDAVLMQRGRTESTISRNPSPQPDL